MKLSVPRLKQIVGACSPTAYVMLMQYYGADITSEHFFEVLWESANN